MLDSFSVYHLGFRLFDILNTCLSTLFNIEAKLFSAILLNTSSCNCFPLNSLVDKDYLSCIPGSSANMRLSLCLGFLCMTSSPTIFTSAQKLPDLTRSSDIFLDQRNEVGLNTKHLPRASFSLVSHS